MAYLETCEEHDKTIAYAVDSGREKCPACELQDQIDSKDAEIEKLKNEIDNMEAE